MAHEDQSPSAHPTLLRAYHISARLQPAWKGAVYYKPWILEDCLKLSAMEKERLNNGDSRKGPDAVWDSIASLARARSSGVTGRRRMPATQYRDVRGVACVSGEAQLFFLIPRASQAGFSLREGRG